MDPSSELYLPSNAGDVIRVEGLCYELVGEVDVPPEEVLVEETFSTCADCESSTVSSELESSTIPSSDLVSSDVPSEVSSLISSEEPSLGSSGDSSLVSSDEVSSEELISSDEFISSDELESSTIDTSSDEDISSAEAEVSSSSGLVAEYALCPVSSDVISSDVEEIVAIYVPCEQSSDVEDVSSGILEEDVSSAISSDVPSGPPEIELSKWYWVREDDYQSANCSGDFQSARMFIMQGQDVVDDFGDWGECGITDDTKHIDFLAGPFNTEQLARDEYEYDSCFPSFTHSFPGTRWYIRHAYFYDPYGSPIGVYEEAWTRGGGIGFDDGDDGFGTCQKIVGGTLYTSAALRDIAMDALGVAGTPWTVPTHPSDS